MKKSFKQHFSQFFINKVFLVCAFFIHPVIQKFFRHFKLCSFFRLISFSLFGPIFRLFLCLSQEPLAVLHNLPLQITYIVVELFAVTGKLVTISRGFYFPFNFHRYPYALIQSSVQKSFILNYRFCLSLIPN